MIFFFLLGKDNDILKIQEIRTICKFRIDQNFKQTFHVFLGGGFLTDTKTPSAGLTTLQNGINVENR